MTLASMRQKTFSLVVSQIQELTRVETESRKGLEVVNDVGDNLFNPLSRWRRKAGREPAPLNCSANQKLHMILRRRSKQLLKCLNALFDLFKLSNHFVMRHGSTLSIVPRSELERLEKRGLEVRG